MADWTSYSTEELAEIYSDYSKDVNGFRDRSISYSDREALIAGLTRLDNYMESMKSTKEGRNILRSEGWVIRESEQEDGWDQAAFDKQFAEEY